MFGAEFVAMKVGVGTLHAIHYRLRMIGIPISGPAYYYEDNILFIHNPQKKKCQHLRKNILQLLPTSLWQEKELLTGHIRSDDDPAALLTKVIMRQKRWHLVSLMLYDIYDEDTKQLATYQAGKLFCD